MKEKAYRNAKKRKYYKFMCIMKKETKVKTTSPPALWIPNAVEIKKNEPIATHNDGSILHFQCEIGFHFFYPNRFL